MNNTDMLVSVSCITYNHEPFIVQCLEGFMMQRTNFSIEVLIHDDASTDKTAEIIKEYQRRYPEIIKPIYQTENQYSKGIGISKTFQFPRAKGKYIALCEGDDYWTDPYKLQKQVDFLEANEEYSFCCHRFKISNMITGEILNEYAHDFYKNGVNLELDSSNLFNTWAMLPLATMFRKCDLDIIIRISKQKKYEYFRDIHLFYHLFKLGRATSLNEFMAVYRWHEGSISSLISEQEHFKDYYLIFGELFRGNNEDETLRKVYLSAVNNILENKSIKLNRIGVVLNGFDACRNRIEYKELLLKFIDLYMLNSSKSNFRRLKRYIKNGLKRYLQ